MDDRLRELERTWATSGAPRDGVALVAARVKAGLVTQDALALAALLGHRLVPEGTAPAALEPRESHLGPAVAFITAAFTDPAGGAPPRLRALADLLERHGREAPPAAVGALRALAAGALEPTDLRRPPMLDVPQQIDLAALIADAAAQGDWRPAIGATFRWMSDRTAPILNSAVFRGAEAAWLGRRLAGHLLLDALPPPERWVAPPLPQGPRPAR